MAAKKKVKKGNPYRDSFGRFTSFEKSRAVSEMMDEGVLNRQTKKKFYPSAREAEELIYTEKIKLNSTGEKNTNTFESEMEYFITLNPKMVIEVINNKGEISKSRGQKGYAIFTKSLRKIRRDLAKKQNDKYPGFIFYYRESLPGDETPIQITFDMRDVTTVEGDPLYNDDGKVDKDE